MFMVKPAYKLATEAHDEAFAGGATSTNAGGSRTIWSSIWKTQAPLKMRIMAWCTATGSLATNLAKCKRHIPAISTCPMCGVERERERAVSMLGVYGKAYVKSGLYQMIRC